MDFEHAKFSLDDLGARFRLRRLDGNIDKTKDLVARRDLYIEVRHSLNRQIALCDRPDERRILRLHPIKIGITTQFKLVSQFLSWQAWVSLSLRFSIIHGNAQGSYEPRLDRDERLDAG